MTTTRKLAGVCLVISMLVIIGGIAAILPQAPGADKSSRAPAVGDEAADFEMAGLDGKNVKLSALVEKGPVVVVVLRGIPSSSCPFCTAQFRDFSGRAESFAAAKASVLMVYPAPADGLKKNAADFVQEMKLPKNVAMLLDADFKFTDAYHLRSKIGGDSANPATFVINQKRKVIFAKVSDSPVQRASAEEVLKVLKSK